MKRMYGLSLVGTIAIAFSWLLFDGASRIDKLRFYHFDAAEWQHASANQRYFMSEYLLDHDMLSHRLRAEVIELLGNDTFHSGFTGELIYALRRKRGLQMDTEPRLVITFDRDGKVKSCCIVSAT